jgi:hypothetical protein
VARGSTLVAGAVAALVLGALPDRVVADAPATVRLTYAAPAACPDEISVKAGVIARLGYDPFAAGATRALAVRVDAVRGGFAATIELVEDGVDAGSRRLPASGTCEDAVAALELALALAIDPAHGAAPPVTPPPVTPPPVTPPPVTPPERARYTPPIAVPQPPSERRSDLGFLYYALATAYPQVMSLLGVDFGYLVAPRWRVGVGLRGGATTGELDSRRDYDGGLVEVRGEGCWVRSVVRACALAGLGRKSIQIEREDESFVRTTVADEASLYGLVGVRAAIVVPLGDRAIAIASVDADAVLPPIHLESEGVVRHEASVVEVGFGFGIGARW